MQRVALGLGMFLALAAEPLVADMAISVVSAQQRYPWNGKVDISYRITGDVSVAERQNAATTGSSSLNVTATDMDSGAVYAATRLSGDTGLEEGLHAFVWDMDEEGLSFKSSNVVFAISCEITPAEYCVIDLSEGAKASSYPVVFLNSEPSGGFNVDEYKTTKLVLRRIAPGAFKMGGTTKTTITTPFLIGVFEMTQSQYQRVTGSNPSGFTGNGKRPVENVSYDMIRGELAGSHWPDSDVVDDASFLGKIRARTGIDFDLPTEAQWEYACRAATTTKYSFGDSANGNYMWYNVNSGECTHEVGTRRPNTWGLYDMHGNVWEWCLDWFGDSVSGGEDPRGPSSGTKRVRRGGAWCNNAASSTSGARYGSDPSYHIQEERGFRLAKTLPSSAATKVLCCGESEKVGIDIAVGERIAARTERIRYSPGWAGVPPQDATANVVVDSVTLESASGAGCVDWTPMSNGTYTLKHIVLKDGGQIGEALTAKFTVNGLFPQDPVISPSSGTVFESGTLSVSMSCPTELATIHYTTDGTEPTVNSPVYARFKVSGRTTVRAIAELGGALSSVVTAEYAPGRCADPVFSLADGAEFAHSNQVVSIEWKNDGVLRYTLDGTDPTAESAIYEGPFSFSDSVELRAKVFSDEFFESSVATSRLSRVWESVAMPVIATAPFTESKSIVLISCASAGSVVRYTTDGSKPNLQSAKYTGPFPAVAGDVVKAYAVNVDYLDSAVASREIVKVWGIGDTMGKADHAFTTGTNGVPGWVRVVDATAPNGEAMKSGAITHEQGSVLETTVMGPGTLTFSWRTSCEEDPGGYFEWDHVELVVDGTAVRWLDGEKAWTNESVRIEGDGVHTVEWRYVKDDAEREGEDAAWVAGYGWASDLTETQTTEVHVPYTWLLQQAPEIVDEYDAYESAAMLTGENGHKVWESYAIGANPNDKNDSLKITAFPMKADGMPDFDAITISPPQTLWNVQGATPVMKGKSTLEGAGEWQAVTDENKAGMRFFRVEVELP